MQYKICFLALSLCALCACQSGTDLLSITNSTEDKGQWVFMQLNVAQDNDKFDSYYYYANISSHLYQQIKHNQIKRGFIHLNQVKYWGNDDLIHDYQNNEEQGDIIFRIEDIKKINPINQEPISGLGIEQFERKSSATSNPYSI